MTDPATGTLEANPAPEPATSAAPQTLYVPTSEAQKAEMRKAAFDKAVATVGTPAPGAAAEPAKAEGPPTFFTKKEEPPAFDPTKLPPELQPIYKSMQADATRKWEEAAQMRRDTEARQAKLDEERRIMLEGQKGLIEALKTRGIEPPPGMPSFKEQIQALRDEGRFAEADELLLNHVDKIAEEKAEPLKREAQKNLMSSTFNETLGTIRAQNPVAAHYWQEVSQDFDAATPEATMLRSVVLQSPETIKQFVPLAVELYALRKHAVTLERNYDAAVKAGIEKGIQERRLAAVKTPGSLVESGSTSRESAAGPMSLKEAFRRAAETS